MSSTKRINLALQGGGSHGAFTWGVLDALIEDERLEFEAVSGTSAGRRVPRNGTRGGAGVTTGAGEAAGVATGAGAAATFARMRSDSPAGGIAFGRPRSRALSACNRAYTSRASAEVASN